MKTSLLASILAISSLVSAQAAQAQAVCVESADLNDTIIYAVPIAFDAAMTSCADEYADDAFMRSDGQDFADRFRAKQDDAWPGAFRLLKVFMSERAGEDSGSDQAISAMVAALPEEQLRPFVDGMVQQMIASEIKPKTCTDIERALELVSPLPVENVSGLVTLIAEMSDLKDPAICGFEPE